MFIDSSVVYLPSEVVYCTVRVCITEIPAYQTLSGHTGRVSCLLYPHNESARYDPNQLVSGGIDFSVCVWDIMAGTRLHKFCVQGGEIIQLLVPPEACSVSASVCLFILARMIISSSSFAHIHNI